MHFWVILKGAMMIKNLVFDMGNVLIEWDPSSIMERFGANKEDRRFIRSIMYKTPEWGMMDWGMMDEDEMEKIAFSKSPERLHGIIHNSLYHWYDEIVQKEGIYDDIKSFKESGYNIYYLSNASRMLNVYFPKIPSSVFFSGGIVSADVGLVKPDERIFKLFLDKFNLKAEECIFIDDLTINAASAIRVGMKAFVFNDNPNELMEFVKENS